MKRAKPAWMPAKKPALSKRPAWPRGVPMPAFRDLAEHALFYEYFDSPEADESEWEEVEQTAPPRKVRKPARPSPRKPISGARIDTLLGLRQSRRKASSRR